MTALITSSKPDFKKTLPRSIDEKEKAGDQPQVKKKAFGIRNVSYVNMIKVLAMEILINPKALLSRLISICPMIGHDVFTFIEKKITKDTKTMTQKINQSIDKLIELAEQEHDLTQADLDEADRLFTEELQLIGRRYKTTCHFEKIKEEARLI